MRKEDEKYSMNERGLIDSRGHLIIEYADTTWRYFKRTKKTLYYISANGKRMIVWKYADDFKVDKVRMC